LNEWIGSKRAINPTAVSGFPSKATGGNIQVIHNGKIVTPQSLISKRAPAGQQPQESSHKGASSDDNGSANGALGSMDKAYRTANNSGDSKEGVVKKVSSMARR
jgi:hypothetical protein